MRGWRTFFGLVLGLFPAASQADAIHDAAKKGDVAAVATALDAGADVNEPDAFGTPLYHAVRRGHLEAAKFLIERGADVNATTKVEPPLMAAASRELIDLITLLLANGADPNAERKGETALHVTAGRGCLSCVEALVAAGADVNAVWIQEPNARTPVHLAKLRDHQDVADYLMTHGVILPKPAPISPKLATADAEKGAVFFDKNCDGCHLVRPDERDSTGPNLWNVVGRDKASRPFKGYSKTMLALEGVWNYEDLNTYLSGPAITTPGVKMEIRGAPDETDRANLIVYLRTLSDSPVPLP
jgi:cytochrome c